MSPLAIVPAPLCLAELAAELYRAHCNTSWAYFMPEVNDIDYTSPIAPTATDKTLPISPQTTKRDYTRADPMVALGSSLTEIANDVRVVSNKVAHQKLNARVAEISRMGKPRAEREPLYAEAVEQYHLDRFGTKDPTLEQMLQGLQEGVDMINAELPPLKKLIVDTEKQARRARHELIILPSKKGSHRVRHLRDLNRKR